MSTCGGRAAGSGIRGAVMKISKWVHGVATGRIRHWNDANNQLVADLWEEIESFEYPMRTALEGALVSSSQAVDRMLGIEVGRDGWMAVDLKDVQRKTLERVYFVLIDLFLALNAKASPSLYHDVHQAKARLFKTKGVLTHISILLKPDDNNTETVTKIIEAAVREAWKEIAELLNSEMASHPIPLFQFHAFVLSSATYNAKELQKLSTQQASASSIDGNSEKGHGQLPHKKIRDFFLGPSVHRDAAVADAVQAAISTGSSLARDIQADLEAAAGFDISSALATPLAVINGGNENTNSGSLLRAACVGTVAAVGIRELYNSRLAGSQTKVLHSMVARAITAWEVGQENIGHAPSPRSGGTHRQFPPGTLTGGKISVANKLMESFILTGQTPREENAKFFAQTIISCLGLSLDPRNDPPEFSVLYKLGLDGGLPILPEAAINTVSERILAVDLFWPSYLEGKEVTW